MKGRMLIGALLLAALLAGTVDLGRAQGPDSSDGDRSGPADGRAGAKGPAGGDARTLPPASGTIHYTGRLDDAAGRPVADGSYDFSFALFEAEAGGQAAWSEVQAAVPVKGGAFAASLGSVTPLPPAVLTRPVLWLAVSVRGPQDADFTPLAPRQRVSAAPPAGPDAGAACPHDHWGEIWTADAADFGLWIYNSGSGDGLRVDTDGSNGVLVYHSAGVGVQVYEAGNDGMHVQTADDDGVYVGKAGFPGATSPSEYANGFEVAGAEGSGLWVGYAGLDGLTVESAGWYGVYVEQSGFDGVRVDSAGHSGVIATSVSAADYGGEFYNSTAGGAGLLAAGGDNTAPDLILGVYGAGDDGRIYSWPAETGSDILLFSNDEAHVHLDEDNNSGSAFVIYNGENTAVWTVTEGGVVAVGTAAGDYGPRTAYPVRATGDWVEDFGTAQLESGEATVPIEPVFGAMVSRDDYQVFLTPLGDCPLYIAAKTPASFTVKAMGGQPCGIAFDYRLVARRLGNEGARLEPAAGGDVEKED